jgi:hypothetical protein
MKLFTISRLLIFLVLHIAICTCVVNGQVTVTGQVFAEVVDVITATETSQLNFGRFSPGPQGGEIIISPGGEISTTGTVVMSGGVHNAATFNITGEEGATFSITLPAGSVTLKHINDSKTMEVSAWVSDPPVGAGTGISDDGSQVVKVGATLEVGIRNDNPVGLYSGSYSITFAYN